MRLFIYSGILWDIGERWIKRQKRDILRKQACRGFKKLCES